VPLILARRTIALLLLAIYMVMTMAVRMIVNRTRRLMTVNVAMDVSTAGAGADGTLPEMQCLPAQHLGDVQCQDGNGKNLSGKVHGARWCRKLLWFSGTRPVLRR
jgi:hypothetical protein